jgi:hypothetical protein
MHADTWATLPCDLLVEILRRLGPTSTTVIHSAAVCRPWRRAIIDNTWCLRVRPDRFLPHLLLTFVDRTWRSEDVIALKGVGVDVGLYNTPLSSRDGFLLLAGDTVNSLCLCNPFAGTCRCLPAAAFGVSKNKCTYVLATDDEHDDPEVRILAVEGENIKDGMPYQVFSSTSGAWGPVTRSGKFELHVDLAQVYMFPEPKAQARRSLPRLRLLDRHRHHHGQGSMDVYVRHRHAHWRHMDHGAARIMRHGTLLPV